MIFVPTTHGKQIPLDAEPNPDGNVMVADGVAYVIVSPAYRDMLRKLPGRTFYMPHHATCPQASEWRTKR